MGARSEVNAGNGMRKMEEGDRIRERKKLFENKHQGQNDTKPSTGKHKYLDKTLINKSENEGRHHQPTLESKSGSMKERIGRDKLKR